MVVVACKVLEAPVVVVAQSVLQDAIPLPLFVRL